MDVERRPEHGGVLHHVKTKADLARHVGEDHVVDGRVHRIVHPDARTRYRWSREELEQAHGAMHPAVQP